MATLADIRSETYALLWEPSDSVNYNTTLVTNRINNIVNRICKWHVRNIITWQQYKAWDLSFLRNEIFYDIPLSVATTAAITSWDDTVSFDTTNFSSEWYVYINWDIIRYTWKTATTITWCTWTDTDIASWAYVYQVFTLPTGISKPFTVYRVHETWRMDEIPYADYRFPEQTKVNYTILTDNDNSVDLFFIRNKEKNDIKYMIQYYINSTDMVVDADVSTIPDPYALTVVAPIAAWELLYDNEEIDDASTKLQRGYAALNEMFDFYNSMNKKSRQKVRFKNYDFSSVNSVVYGKMRQYN